MRSRKGALKNYSHLNVGLGPFTLHFGISTIFDFEKGGKDRAPGRFESKILNADSRYRNRNNNDDDEDHIFRWSYQSNSNDAIVLLQNLTFNLHRQQTISIFRYNIIICEFELREIES